MTKKREHPRAETRRGKWWSAAAVGIWPWFFALALIIQLRSSEAGGFRTSILPILTKAGCNAGACHGAATGQGGFKLSLLGYDPEEDYERITREFGGRRIELERPELSLFLRKPTRQLEHEGGRRLARNSQGYETLLRWIADGAPYGSRDLHVTAIEVTPADSLLAGTNATIALRVMAALSDGSAEDVTALTLYTSNDDAIAEVNKSGQATTRGHGITSIMTRYGGQVAAARVTVPFNKAGAPDPNFTAHNFIDEHVQAELNRLGLPASPLSQSAEFLRRVHLDLSGRLPSPEEAREFIGGSDSAGRRQRVIENLLARDEFVDLWTMHLADLLLLGGKAGSEAGTRAYHKWLREQVAQNVPFNQITRSLLTATGELETAGPANFFLLASDPRDLAEHVGRMFLGTQIACARCHAHPADRWTQEDYHRFAAFFARLKRDGSSIGLSPQGEVDHPKSRQALAPRPLGTAALPVRPSEDRRVELAAWLTAPENSFFARTIVNRVWKHLFGRGLVEPVDDLRPTNPPTHPGLLDALAAAFVRDGYDLRQLIRTIMFSRTYQLSSRTVDGNSADDRFYSHAFIKELPAQVFVDAIAQVTGVPDHFNGYPEGTRAVQLIGSKVPSFALDVLGRCARDRACDTSGRAGGGLAQALHLINGSTINDKLGRGIGAEWKARGWVELIEEIYLRALSRLPKPQELSAWGEMLAAATSKAEAIEDLVWTILNSREFAYNH